MTECIFSFDTEDFVTPESDDVLKAIADMLAGHGIRASFAVVGDKARALRGRGRRDVIEAVRRHDVQYHANTHLIWPQTTLELSRMDWDEGVDLVMETERHGIEDVAETFGQRPIAWIRCGGNWDPRLLYGLNLLGIEGYVPSAYLLPGGGPLWHANTLNYWYSIAIERYFEPGASPEALLDEFRRQKQALAGGPTAIVAFAHPCMFTTARFYDLHNQERHGVFLPKAAWRPAPLLPRDEVRRRLDILDRLARLAASDRDVEIISHTDFIRRRREQPRWLCRDELTEAARAIRDRLDYQALGPGYLSAADVFAALSLALRRRQAEGALPEAVPVRRVIGPTAPAPALEAPFATTIEAVAAACAQVEDEIDRHHRMPSRVCLEGRAVSPASFIAAMAEALAASPGASLTVAPAREYPLCRETIYRDVRVRSSELPDDFQEGTITTHTHLQSWTARPAVRGEAP